MKVRTSILPAVAALAAIFLVLPTTGADAEVTIIEGRQGLAYVPAPLEIEPGARVAFTNETDTTHTATCTTCPVDSGDVLPNQTKMVVFPDEGAFTFNCRYHPEALAGSITVGNPPAPSPSPAPTA